MKDERGHTKEAEKQPWREGASDGEASRCKSGGGEV